MNKVRPKEKRLSIIIDDVFRQAITAALVERIDCASRMTDKAYKKGADTAPIIGGVLDDMHWAHEQISRVCEAASALLSKEGEKSDGCG